MSLRNRIFYLCMAIGLSHSIQAGAQPITTFLYLGETGKYQKIVENEQGKDIRRVTHAVKIVATQDLNLRSCTVHFANGSSGSFIVGQIKKNEARLFSLGGRFNTASVLCRGTAVFNGTRGSLKVYIAAVQGGGIGPVPIIPNPNPVPGPGPQPRPGLRVLPPQTKRICVKESKELIQLRNQAEYWKVNGQGSRLNTWTYRGNASTLTLDFATADVQAYCRKPGVDLFQIEWKIAFTDPNRYALTYTVNCVPCINKQKAKKLAGLIEDGNRLIHRGEFEAAIGRIKRALELIEELLEDPETPAASLEDLSELHRLVEDLRTALSRDRPVDGIVEEISDVLTHLAQWSDL